MSLRSIKLEDACELITKGTTPTTVGFSFVEQGIPFVRAEDLQGDIVNLQTVSNFVTPECHASLRRSQLKAGDLLVSIAGTIGRIGIVPETVEAANTNQAVGILRLKPNLLNKLYLGYFIRSDQTQRQFVREGTTATITNVSLGQLKSLEVPFLPLHVQEQIVDILSRAEGIVRLQQQALDRAKALIPALFVELFGDSATNPKGWPLLKVADFVRAFQGGKNFQSAGENEALSGLRILKVSAVTQGEYRPEESKPVPQGYVAPQNHFVRKGDLLFSRANTEELVGATAYVYEESPNMLLPDKLWRFVWKDEKPMEPSFVLALFQNQRVRSKLSQIASGTSGSMKNISQGKLMELELPIPPFVKQKEFAIRFAEAQSIITQQSAALTKSRELFDALLAQTFSTPSIE